MRKTIPLIALLVIAALALSASAANMTYMTVKANKQGQFKGDSTVKDQKDAITVLSFSMEVDSPRDPNTGQPSGKRMHKPITITKEIDASSPQFFQAAVTNEILDKVVIEFAKSDARGAETIYYKVTLTNAAIAGFKQYTPETAVARTPAGTTIEEISLTYQKIEIDSVAGKTTAIDDWTTK